MIIKNGFMGDCPFIWFNNDFEVENLNDEEKLRIEQSIKQYHPHLRLIKSEVIPSNRYTHYIKVTFHKKAA